MNLKKLSIILSNLKSIDSPKLKYEQYQTSGELAAKMIWTAVEDISGKTVCDLGCGNGILGIGALVMGAKSATFVDIDADSIETAKENAKSFKNTKFVMSDVENFNEKFDTIVMNPPFGAQNKHYDKMFLEKAFLIANTVYSLHKFSTIEFLKKFAEKNNRTAEILFKAKFPLKHQYEHHTKPVSSTEVVFCRFKKNYLINTQYQKLSNKKEHL